jgi:flagella basal body P-ring formation protein FlgA
MATVSGDTVQLGDLFSNTGNAASAVVDQAPEPGAEKTYDVHQLAAIARAHGLFWQAQSWSEKVVVKRQGRLIDTDEIRATIGTALEAEGLEGKWELMFSRGLPTLHVAADQTALPQVANLQWRKRTGHFSAVITVGPEDPGEARLTVSGRVHRLIEVPTITRRIKTGEIIQADDIKWLDLRGRLVNRNVITDADQLVGMTPQRFLSPGRPVRVGDVRKPRIVKKGSIVTMVVTTPNMVLTSKGRALDHGTRGDTIRISNLKSKTIVEAEVTGPNAVRIFTTTNLPSINTARR